MESREQKIVIVEDEGLIAADLRGRLERAGYHVPAIAATGGEALEVIREKSPDLILMDIRLKGKLDGIQVADRVRHDFDIPVIFLTAYEDRDTLARASKTQAFGYIKKPIASASLQGSIEMALSKHRHERYLREQMDWFSASFASLPDAVMVTDGLGRISYLNRVAEELTGWKVDEALGKFSTELLRLRYRSGRPVEDFVPVAMLEGIQVPWPAEIRLESPDGRSRAIEGSVAPRSREGWAEGVVITFKDVTLRQFEDEQARQDHKHEALSRLADGIAGHLDLELSVVAGESTRLLKSLPNDSTLRATAEAIENAALDAFSVTCRLRAFGQEGEFHPQVVQVNEVLRDAQTKWSGALPGLTVQPDAAPRPVHADSGELARVLDILLQHAHHWMDAGGGIAVAASGAELDGLHEWVCIRIAYNSTGEEAAALERAFDPSWDGNWEGLPFAYGVTKRMGGLLRARMETGRKVVFEVYLPSVEVTAAGVPIEPADQRVLLVIEPNSEVRRVLRVHFERHGYKVLEAGDCANGVRLAESVQPPIRVAIANPAAHDPGRMELAQKLVDAQPGVCVRLTEGYRHKEGETGSRSQTKWDLLEWANDALGQVAWVAAAN